MKSADSQTNRSFYDRMSHVYDLIADAGEHRAREAGESALDVMPGERVLEIGFGTGNAMLRLAESVGPDGHVDGIDVSSGMKTVASKKMIEHGLDDRVDLAIGDARELPYPDGQFDAVFASFTLELFALDDIPVVLAEIRRVLKSGGRVGVVSMATVKDGDSASMLEQTYIWMHQHFPHIVDCQPIDVTRRVRDAGFEILKELEIEIWTMPVRAVIGRAE